MAAMKRNSADGLFTKPPVLGFEATKQQLGIRAAKTERIGKHYFYVRFSIDIGDIVQVTFRIRGLVVDGWRYNSMYYGEYRKGTLRTTRSSQ